MQIRVSEEDKFLEFDQDGMGARVYPSSETGQTTSGLRRVSTTWKFEQDGKQYRVQLQVTHPAP